MRRALFILIAVSACGSTEKPARTEIAIAPASTTSTPPAPVTIDASMNAEPPSNNNPSDENALVIRMTEPKNTNHGVPVVHVDDDTTEAGGERLIIRRVLRQNAGTLRACYEKGLAKKPDLAGRVVLRFTIEASGALTKPESTTGTTLADADVVACVVHALEPLVFPRQRAGALNVGNYPIVFVP